jgi:Tfp pilus assembly protein PilX
LLAINRGNNMTQQKQNERGMALVLTLIALLIVTSIGLTMAFSTDTETTINSNFRDEQTAYYAAKAGLEEARDRMASSASASINSSLPTTLAGAAGGVLYIINPSGSETVAPWTVPTTSSPNSYFDDEICKEVSCGTGNSVPTASGWYKSTVPTASSTYASSPVLPYKWMRISLKSNASPRGGPVAHTTLCTWTAIPSMRLITSAGTGQMKLRNPQPAQHPIRRFT